MEIIIAIVIGVIIWFILKNRKPANKTKTKLISNRDLYTYNIVGEQSYQNNLKKIAGPKKMNRSFLNVRQKSVQSHLTSMIRMLLRWKLMA